MVPLSYVDPGTARRYASDMADVRDDQPQRMTRAALIVIAVAATGSWLAAWQLPSGAATIAAVAVAAALSTLALHSCWTRVRDARGTNTTCCRAIIDAATEAIVTIDARGTIETINDAALELFGYTAEEIVGENVATLMPSPYRDEHDAYLARYLETGERHIIGSGREVVARHKNGGQFPIELSVGEGAIDGRPFFTAILRDVSERTELQAKLAQTERLAAVGELAAGVAHEINNPINTMINCAQLIQDGDDPVENGGIIIEEGGRIADIVRSLLQFARDDRDRAQPTSLSEVVERTMGLIGENW